ncbi:MAG: D-2-hydroxyacid dehydrogenase [Lactobacillaceae bacterium]|jgi:D-lactate dehydrogenase|nr:D-2-hydroxyacid dehydrogenase [Lactobacillaceae bacterium]
MTKILMTSVSDDEIPAIKAYEARNNIEIVMSRDEFHPENTPDLTGIDGLVIQQTATIGGDAAFYEKLKAGGLQQIATRTAGYDMVPVALAKAAGLKVTNVPAYSPRSVAEMALMQIFRLLRRTPEFDARIAANDFRWEGLQSREIHSVTVGIIGAGRIGGTLAQMLHVLGATVLAYDVKPREELKELVTYVSKAELLAQSDVISLHVDLNPTSTGLLTAPDFAQMKVGGLLVNASRGPVINTDDLIAALEAGKLHAAALDTVEDESAVFNHDLRETGVPDARIQKLLDMPNVILTPHIAFFTNIAVENMVDISLDDTMQIIKGETSAHEI